jgi:hypothetical protein
MILRLAERDTPARTNTHWIDANQILAIWVDSGTE